MHGIIYAVIKHSLGVMRLRSPCILKGMGALNAPAPIAGQLRPQRCPMFCMLHAGSGEWEEMRR